MWYVINKEHEIVALYEEEPKAEKWAKEDAEAIGGTYVNSKDYWTKA